MSGCSGHDAGYSAGAPISKFGLPLPLNDSGAQSSTTASGVTQNANGSTVTITNTTAQNVTGKSADQVIASLSSQSQGLTTDNARARANPLNQNPDVSGVVSSDQDVQGAAANAVGSTVLGSHAPSKAPASRHSPPPGQRRKVLILRSNTLACMAYSFR